MNKGSILRFSLKLYAKSLVAGLLAFIMNTVLLAAYESHLLNIVVVSVCFILEGVIIYTEAWNQGFSDINRDKNEGKKTDVLKGLKAGLIASIPIFILTLLLLLCKASVVNEAFIALYRIFNTIYQPMSLSFLPSTLTGAEIPLVNYIIMSLTALVIPFFATPGYYLGYNDFQISADLLYIQKKNK